MFIDQTLIKRNLDKKDLELLIDKIIVFEDRIHVKLKADIGNRLKVGVVTTFYYQQIEGREELLKVAEDPTVNFNQDSKVIAKKMESPDTYNNSTKSGINDLLSTMFKLKTRNQPERLFTVNVISSGDRLLIV